MAKISDYPDRFSFDVASDLERIDGAFTRLLADRNQWQEFLKDPNGVLVKFSRSQNRRSITENFDFPSLATIHLF